MSVNIEQLNIFHFETLDFGMSGSSIVTMVYKVGYLTTSLCIVPQVSIKLLCSTKAAQQVGRSCFFILSLLFYYCDHII